MKFVLMGIFRITSHLVIGLLLVSRLYSQSHTIIPSHVTGKYGVMGKNRKPLIAFEYDTIIHFASFFLAKKNSSWQYINRKGTLVDRFDTICFFSNGYAKYKQQGQWGLLKPDGTPLFKPMYQAIVYDSVSGCIKFNTFQAYYVLSKTNDTLLRIEADELVPLSRSSYAYSRGNRWGVVRNNPYVMTDLLYTSIIPMTDNIWLVTSTNQKKGVIDTLGRELVPCLYDDVRFEENSFIVSVQDNQKQVVYQLLDRYGNPLTHAWYQRVYRPGDMPIMFVQQGNRYGLLHVSGQWVVPLQDNPIIDFSMEGYLVKKECSITWHYYTSVSSVSFTEVDSVYYLSPQLMGCTTPNEIHLFDVDKGCEKYCYKGHLVNKYGSFIQFQRDGKKGLINMYGREIVPPLYDSVSMHYLKDSVIWLFSGKLKTIIDCNGSVVHSADSLWKELYFFNKGDWIGIKKNHKYGFVDARGRLRIANQYEAIGPFSNNMAAVQLRGLWGYVNRVEKLIVQPYYDKVFPFQQHAAIVKKNGLFGIVNQQGIESTPTYYDSISYNSFYKLYLSYRKGKKGVISSHGEEAIYAKYDAIIPVSNTQFIVKLNQHWGLVSIQDVIIYAIVYDGLSYNPYDGCIIGIKKGLVQIIPTPH